mgnify:CR=1 FL=1
MKKRALTLLIALLMVLPMFTACSENAADTTETTAADTTTTVETPSAEEEVVVEEDEPEILPDIPALDFEGRTFTFLTSGIGDTNGDNAYDGVDIMEIGQNANYVTDWEYGGTNEEYKAAAGDVSNDGMLDGGDAAIIKDIGNFKGTINQVVSPDGESSFIEY